MLPKTIHDKPMHERLRRAVEPPRETRLKVDKSYEECLRAQDLSKLKSTRAPPTSEAPSLHEEHLSIEPARGAITGESKERVRISFEQEIDSISSPLDSY